LALGAPSIAAAAPRAVITGGPEPQTTATDATLSFAPSARAPFGGRLECRFDGGAWAPCTSPVTLTGLVGGTHGFDVRLVGFFTDPTPATHTWTITVDTVVVVPPLPVPSPPPGPPPAPGRTGCRDANATPRTATPARLERATLCLLNRRRARVGLRAVRRSPVLAAVARRYAATMVRRKFLSHTSPWGATFVDRVRSGGYLRRRPWAVGEVIAWSERATPARQVRALLASPPHRHVILTPTYRDAGVGVAIGSPVSGARRGMVTVANFGRTG
jgi:uncharacterized protein YkwD